MEDTERTADRRSSTNHWQHGSIGLVLWRKGATTSWVPPPSMLVGTNNTTIVSFERRYLTWVFERDHGS